MSQEQQPTPPLSVKRPLNRYMTRRETHSSRAVVTSVTLLLVLAVIIFFVVGTIIRLAGYKPLFGPLEFARVLSDSMFTVAPWVLWVCGGGAILVGLFLLWKALAPGWLNRHAMSDSRMAVVVDDAVIASGVSASVRQFCGLAPGQTKTSVSLRKVRVNVTPTSGKPLEHAKVLQHAEGTVASYQLRPTPKVRVEIAPQGVIEP